MSVLDFHTHRHVALTQPCKFRRVLSLALAMLACAPFVWAQSEMNDFSRVGQSAIGSTLVSDYQCLGVNPANLGFIPSSTEFRATSPIDGGLTRERRHLSFTVAEVGAAVNSDAMGSTDLIDAMFNVNAQNFNQAQKVQAALRFSGKGVYMNADLISFGAAYQTEYSGGFALQVRDRISGEFVLNSFAAQFAFLGRKAPYFDSSYVESWSPTDTIGVARHPKLYSQLFDSTRISMSWTREYSFGYGKDIFYSDRFQMYAGLSVKYIQGFALLNSYIDDQKNLVAYSSISPLFNINYGKSVTPSHIDGSGLLPVGSGYGVDVGITMVFRRRYRLSLSVVDIGSIRWKGNVYSAQDYVMNGVSSTGFNSYNLFTEAQKITGDGGYFKWAGLQEVTTTLPARVRIGGSYEYGRLRYGGIDIEIPAVSKFPGNLSTVFISGGLNHGINEWIAVQGGLCFGGSMGFNMPVGVMFSVFDGVWEFGISTRDLLTYVFDKNPTVGWSVALARIRW